MNGKKPGVIMNHKNIIFFSISIALSIGAFSYLFIYLDDFPLEKIHLIWIAIALLCSLLFWLGDALCMLILFRGIHVYARYFTLLKSSFIGFFASTVTPFSIGNIPAQWVYLEKQGIRLDKSIPALMMKSIINLFIRGSLALAIFWNFPVSIASNAQWFIQSILLFYGSSIVIIYLLVFNHSKIIVHYRIAFAHLCLKLSKRFGLFRVPLVKMSESIKQMHYSATAYTKSFACIFLSAVIILTAFFIQSTLPYSLIRSLGNQTSLLPSILSHASFFLLQPFLPTPGGSGLAEMSFNYMLNQWLGVSYPWVVLLWRLATFFLPLFIGIVFMVLSFSEDAQLVKSKQK